MDRTETKTSNIIVMPILANSYADYGLAMYSYYCAFTLRDEGKVVAHEIGHTLGQVMDEYNSYYNWGFPNSSDTNDPETIKWKTLLGFRYTTIFKAANAVNHYTPSSGCLMRYLNWQYCEVCKLSIARRLNNSSFTQSPRNLYVAIPDVTTEHSITPERSEYNDSRINEQNIEKANGHELEFRTIIQNFENKDKPIEMKLKITGADGTVKCEATETVTVPAQSNPDNLDVGLASCSVKIPKEKVTGLTAGDKIEGQVIDKETGEVLATDKTETQTWKNVNISYKIVGEDGDTSKAVDMPLANTAQVPVPQGTNYQIQAPKAVHGYTFVSSSQSGSVTVTDDVNLTYYYKKSAEQPVEPPVEEKEPVITATDRTVEYGSTFNPLEGVSATDGNGQTIELKQGENLQIDSKVDTNTPGTYDVTYTLTHNGKTVTKKITVTVTAKPVDPVDPPVTPEDKAEAWKKTHQQILNKTKV